MNIDTLISSFFIQISIFTDVESPVPGTPMAVPYYGAGATGRLLGLRYQQIWADIDGEAAGDASGWAVSLSADGTIVAIGAYSNGLAQV